MTIAVVVGYVVVVGVVVVVVVVVGVFGVDSECLTAKIPKFWSSFSLEVFQYSFICRKTHSKMELKLKRI